MKKATLLLFTLLLFTQLTNAQDTWTKKADFSGGARYDAIGFSIGNKGYIGTGFSVSFQQDFWEWDQGSNVWTQKADFGGGPRAGATAFAINAKGYIGTGRDKDSLRSDFWEWDQGSNTWNKRSNFRGPARDLAVGFSIGNTGYICTGQNYGLGSLSDLWEYDTGTDNWIQKSSLGGSARQYASGFAMAQKGYVLLGGATQNGPYTFDFWSWDKNANAWTQMSNFQTGFLAEERAGAVAFAMGTKAYVGTGFQQCGGPCVKFLKDFWEWDQITNTWSSKTNFGGTERWSAVGFAIGNKGYIGTGSDISSSFADFWEWGISSSGINEVNNKLEVLVFPNPGNGIFNLSINGKISKTEIYDLSGKQLQVYIRGEEQLDLSFLPNGHYLIKVTNEQMESGSQKIAILRN